MPDGEEEGGGLEEKVAWGAPRATRAWREGKKKKEEEAVAIPL